MTLLVREKDHRLFTSNWFRFGANILEFSSRIAFLPSFCFVTHTEEIIAFNSDSSKNNNSNNNNNNNYSITILNMIRLKSKIQQTRTRVSSKGKYQYQNLRTKKINQPQKMLKP